MKEFFIIQNSGIADIRNLRLLGLSDKGENKDAIGMFGSGFKYSLALLARLDALPIIFLGKERLSFSIENDEIFYSFRGEKTPSSIHINFGKYDWTDPWFALRELICNAYDVNGSFKVKTTEEPPITDDTTTVCVPINMKISLAIANISNRLLWDKTPIHENVFGKIYHGNGVFKKGVFVRDLEEKGKTLCYAYDANNLKLSESRSCDQRDARYYIANIIGYASLEILIRLLREENALEKTLNIYCNNPNLQKAIHTVYGENAIPCSIRNVIIWNQLIENGFKPINVGEWLTFCDASMVRSPENVLGKNAATHAVKFTEHKDIFGIIAKINNIVFSNNSIPKVKWFENKIDCNGKTLKGFAEKDYIAFNVDYYGETSDFSKTVIEELGHYHANVNDGRGLTELLLDKIVKAYKL